jgi:hypothetical protein
VRINNLINLKAPFESSRCLCHYRQSRYALANVCASIVRHPSGGILCPVTCRSTRALAKLTRLTFFTVHRKDIPFVRADLVSKDTFEHFTDFLWSESLNNVKPAA